MPSVLLRICFPLTKMTGSRLLNTARTLYATDKGLLAKLRKKTGFSISNCKKALEMHNNDFSKAEAWLQAEAQAQGWEKATKLSGRKTSQGLIGIHIEGQTASMVEVNCETDFVARNEKFQALVAQVARDCWSCHTQTQDAGLVKEVLSEEQVRAVTTSDGKTLADKLALAIGSIGENMSLPRAARVTAGPDTTLVGYCHPSTIEQEILTGKYGVILAVKAPNDITEVLKQLCVHVIGMNPKAIGSPTEPKADNPEEETLLVHQEFLSDQTKTVGQVLEEENIEITDYLRFECGEQTAVDQSS